MRASATVSVVVLFLASFFATQIYAVPSPQEMTSYALNIPETCRETPAANEFSHSRILFSRSDKQHSEGYGENLKGIAGQEMRLRATFPGIHAYLAGVTSLFGLCGWRPENLSLPFSVENQVILAQGEEITAIMWRTQFAFQWNFRPTFLGLAPDSEIALALEHTQWLGGSGDIANKATKQLALQIKKKEIVAEAVQEVSVVSLNFAHKFAVTQTMTAEYLVGKYLWQIPFSRFVTSLGGVLSSREERTRYRYDGFFDGNLAWRLTPLFDIAGEAKTEFSAKENPHMLGVGANMYASARRAFGASIAKRWYRGMEDNSLNMTRWGVWMPSQDTVYELFVRLAF